MGARAGDQEAHGVHPLHDAARAAEGVERDLEALLVDEAAREQDEALVGRRVAGAQRVERRRGLRLERVQAVRDHVDRLLGSPKTSPTCPRMYCEQTITPSARRAIHDSTPWTWACGCMSTQPPWRPCSVAWIVVR